MQYIGGKQKSGGSRIAPRVLEAARHLRTECVTEPFCGGLSVTYRLDSLNRLPSDACLPLITLYREVLKGWAPPKVVGRETWEHFRANPDPHDPMTAFCGFGCSRSGAWFSGFIEDYKYTDRRVPAAQAARDSLIKKLSRCRDVKFKCLDYQEAPMVGLAYCDPPYRGTLTYPAVGEFDSDAFFAWAEDRSKGNIILVSEKQAPEGWVALETWDVQRRLTTTGGGTRTENLWIHERWASMFAPGNKK